MSGKELDCYSDELLGFAIACLFSGAVSKEEFRLWCVDMFSPGDIPDFFIELAQFDGEIFQIYKTIGHVPCWEHTESEEYAIYGIAVKRGRAPSDMPVTHEAALQALEECSSVAWLFRRVFGGL